MERDCSDLTLTRMVPLFHWLVTFLVDNSLRRGVTCLSIFEGRKLEFVFLENHFSLKELIGYMQLTDFREI